MSFAHITSKLPSILPRHPSHTVIQRCKSGSANQVVPKDEFKVLTPTSNLTQIGGYKIARDRLGDIVRYFQNPGKYTCAGVKAPKGVILSGPPGTGKTFLAEATAGHAGVPLIQLSGSEVYSKWVGVAEEKLRSLFQQARNLAPCVVCIDEFDSMGNTRITKVDDSTNAVHINARVNQLLALLSEEHKGVVVIATTNHYEALDSAVVRPGRFDKHIALALPNESERCEILAIHTRNKKLDPALSVQDLAQLTSGFSGAKLAGWVNEAALTALRMNSPVIDMTHLDEARTIISEGIGRPIENQAEKYRIAVHEAAHAILCYLLGFRIYKISIYQTEKVKGFVELYPQDANLTKKQLLDQVCCSLAGRAGEDKLGITASGSYDDFENAFETARYMVYSEGMGATLSGTKHDINAIVESQMKRATHYLTESEEKWLKLVDTLVEHNELLEHEFLAVINGNPITKKRKHASQLTLELPPITSRKHRF